MKPVVTEHRSYERQCGKCGQVNRGSYPKGIKEIIADIFQISISEGTVVNVSSGLDC